MIESKREIEEFDNLCITDLIKKPTKELIIAIYIKTKEQNSKLSNHDDKLKWHDRFVWGIISIIGLGILGAVVTAIVKYAFG